MIPLRETRRCTVPRGRLSPWRAAAALAAAIALSAPAAAQEKKADGPPEVTVSVAVGPAFPLGAAAQRWAELITERVDKAFVARLHPGATLAQRDPAREFAALPAGKADLAVGSALQWSLQLPALGVYCLPWLAPGTKEIEALTADAALTAALAAKLDAAGVTLVAVAPLGWRALATTARAINGPDDLKGLRLRVAPLPLLRDVVLALEAAPQSMGFADAQAAFARGTLDGQEAMPTVLAATRIDAAGQKHVADWRAVADVMVFAVRNELWQRWPEATTGDGARGGGRGHPRRRGACARGRGADAARARRHRGRADHGGGPRGVSRCDARCGHAVAGGDRRRHRGAGRAGARGRRSGAGRSRRARDGRSARIRSRAASRSSAANGSLPVDRSSRTRRPLAPRRRRRPAYRRWRPSRTAVSPTFGRRVGMISTQ